MSTNINILSVRKILGTENWNVPVPFGPDGWDIVKKDLSSSVIITCASNPEDNIEWLHASIAKVNEMPTYADLVLLYKAVWKGKGWAYQIFAPNNDHINIRQYALHLWGRLDGQPVMPNFGKEGTI